MSSPTCSPFEDAFPAVFAVAVKDLVDDSPLNRLLERTCAGVEERLASTSIGLIRFGESGADVTIAAPDGPVRFSRDVRGIGSSPWGRLSASAPTGVELDLARLESLVGFVDWLVERHSVRRRRLDTIDRERQVIAGQLHDDSIQAMTAISLNLQRLARTADNGQEQIQHLLHLTNDAIDRLRHMMFALHPPTLATDGLVATLEDYLDGFIAPMGLRTAVTGDVSRRAAPGIEALAFRLARGAVHNSVKHAQAGAIEVDVAYRGTAVRVTVRDDGVGFDESSIGHGGVGHAGIDYAMDLAAEVGGRYDVVGAPGRGTTVTIELPLT